ncbi:MAG: hypothetical protein IJ453_03720 [Oscillospiraceae bacterium]|nr:hypothetical protein [Oscillospiraceae bacterium]
MKRLMASLLALAMLLALLPLGLAAAEGNPGDYGWQTDDGNFSGWSATDADHFSGNYSNMANYARMWREVLRGQNNFRISMDVTASNRTRVYMKLLGVKLELNGTGGTGNQLFVKLNDSNVDWFNCTGCVTEVIYSRKDGGDVTITLNGADNETPVVLTSAALEDSANFEIGMYEGTVDVTNFSFESEYDIAGSVKEAGYAFLFSTGNDIWDAETGWTWGSDLNKGLWTRSAQTDGGSAQTAYVGEKLMGNWSATARFNVISENNGGRSVSRMNILDQHYHSKAIFTVEKSNGGVCFTLQSASVASGASWTTHWSSGWITDEDGGYTVTLSGDKLGSMHLQLRGDKDYSYEQNVSVLDETAALFCYLGFSTERSTVSFENIDVHNDFEGYDAAKEAKTAYENLVKNYVDPATNATYSMDCGLREGYVTNTGLTIHINEPGGFWDVSIVIMAMDTYARTLDPDSEEYEAVAEIIANSVNRINVGHGEERVTTASTGPLNWAMDDCGWNIMALILGYRYNTFLGRTSEAAVCLDYAKKLFHSTYDTYYDDALFGGLWYNSNKTDKSIYAATVAIAGWDLYEITGDQLIYDRMMNVYNSLENNLRRSDGLYWMSVSADGVEGRNNPYGIGEGGSCTYIGGNMAMAVLNARLGNTQKAADTAWGIAMFETTEKGAYLNDRDAWNNTFFLGMFQREVVNTGIVDERYNSILLATAQTILENAVFEDGYYSAAWEGPKEPSSDGYPADYEGERNNWGRQEYGWCTGSFPKQSYTSATTAHVIIATAAIAETVPAANPGDFGWSSDSEDFSGWIALDGENFSVDTAAASNNRVWKELLSDTSDFTLTLDITSSADSSAYLKVLGQTLELDARGGNGNQSFVKLNGTACDWIPAAGGKVHVTITRLLGGDLQLSLLGEGESSAVRFTLSPSEESSNVEVGAYAGLCSFAEIAVTEPVLPTPGDFGWHSDSEDFSGWKALDEANFSAAYAEVQNHRVWKELISDPENFSVDLDVANDNTSSTYIKVQGISLELDSNNGSGNQTFMKVGGVNYDWLSGNGCKFHVTIARSNGGDLNVTVTGAGNETPFTATASPTENNENVELGLYRGVASFREISVTNGAAEEPAEPTEVTVKISHTVSFDSDLQMNYRIKLADILAAVPNYVTEGAYLTVEKDRYPMGGGEKTVETVTLYPDLTTDPTRLLFNLSGIQSVEMGSDLRAVLHFFDTDGNEYYTTVDTYSVLDYAELCFDYYDPAKDAYLFTMIID